MMINDDEFFVENQQPFNLEEYLDDAKSGIYAGLNNSKISQNINDDSLTLRQQRDSYLKQFNDNRSGKKQMDIQNLNVSSGPNLDRSPPVNTRPVSPKYEQ